MVSRTIIVIIVVTLVAYLFSCGGGNGNGDEEFIVFDVTISVLELETQNAANTDCPESADLKLSLIIDGNSISGFAELIGFGNIGDSTPISGIVEGNNFSIDSFAVGVSGCEVPFFSPEPEPICSLSFSFNTFEGQLLDTDGDGDFDSIQGTITGSIFSLREIQILCDSQFTGEFTGVLRSPEGCISRLEIPTLECPAEGFVNPCKDEDYYFCFGFCEPLDEGIICVDFEFNATQCEIIDCETLICPQVGTIHLKEEGGFMFIIGEHVLQCG